MCWGKRAVDIRSQQQRYPTIVVIGVPLGIARHRDQAACGLAGHSTGAMLLPRHAMLKLLACYTRWALSLCMYDASPSYQRAVFGCACLRQRCLYHRPSGVRRRETMRARHSGVRHLARKRPMLGEHLQGLRLGFGMA